MQKHPKLVNSIRLVFNFKASITSALHCSCLRHSRASKMFTLNFYVAMPCPVFGKPKRRFATMVHKSADGSGACRLFRIGAVQILPQVNGFLLAESIGALQRHLMALVHVMARCIEVPLQATVGSPQLADWSSGERTKRALCTRIDTNCVSLLKAHSPRTFLALSDN